MHILLIFWIFLSIFYILKSKCRVWHYICFLLRTLITGQILCLEMCFGVGLGKFWKILIK